MNQKRKKIKVRAIIAILLLFCTAYITIYEWRAHQYREDFKTRAIPVALERAKMECLKEGISQEACDNLVAKPWAESSECGSRVCWTIYVDAQDKEVYTSSITVSEQDDTMVVTDYFRNQFKRLP